MSPPITHERCSELLAGYMAGELSSAPRSLVHDHLAGCPDCAAERDALVALVAPLDEPLTGDERAVLRTAVLGTTPAAQDAAEVTLEDETDAVIVPIGGWRSNAAKYIGVAAMLALLAVGFAYLGNVGVNGSGGSAEDSGGAEGLTGPAPARGGKGNAGGESGSDQKAKGTEDAASAEDESLSPARRFTMRAFLDADAGPVFDDDRGAITAGGIDALAARPVLASFSAAYSFRDARLSSKPALAALAETAPDELAPVVRRCGRNALSGFAEPALAAYGTTATIEGRDSLVLGFVTGEESLNRYELVTWDVGDCSTIVFSRGGPIP